MSVKGFGLGVALRGLGDPVGLLRVCGEAERLGYSSLWFVEVADVDAFAMSVAAAHATRTIGVATGVANSYLRLPTLTAMSAATVGALTAGRFTLGLGAGSSPLTSAGISQGETSLQRFRETLEIVVQVLRTGGASYRGRHFSVEGFRLGFTPPKVPVYGAAMGLGAVRVVARLADGVILMLATLDHVRRALEVVREELSKRGVGPEGFGVACHLVTACSEDPEEALKQAKRAVAAYSSIPAYRRNFERLGYRSEVEEIGCARRGGAPDPAEAVPDRMADDLIVYGDSEQCKKKIERYVEAGVTNPIVYPFAPSPQGYHKMLENTLRALAPTS